MARTKQRYWVVIEPIYSLPYRQQWNKGHVISQNEYETMLEWQSKDGLDLSVMVRCFQEVNNG